MIPTNKNHRALLDSLPRDTKIEVSSDRYFSAHHMMIWAAKEALNLASSPQNALVVVAMCASAAEALANAVGQLIFPEDWEDYDQLSPWGKYRLICRELKIPCSKSKGIGQGLNELLKLRNHIAHAKPQQAKRSVTLTVEQYDASNWHVVYLFPRSKLEEKLTHEIANKAVDSIAPMMAAIVEALPGDNNVFIAGNVATHSISVVKDFDGA